MKIVIPSGSGHPGQTLARDFIATGHDVLVLSWFPDQMQLPCRSLFWDSASCGDWAAEIDSADVVINLAGRSVNCRYVPAYRRAILDSRVNSTPVVGAAIARAKRPYASGCKLRRRRFMHIATMPPMTNTRHVGWR